MTRALTMLNQAGDTTITWTPDRDDEMAEIIQKKMDDGCVFFIIEPRFGGRMPLQRAQDAREYRALAIPDEHLLKFVSEGKGETVKTPAAKVRTRRKAATAKEAASTETVGVRQERGG